MSRTKWSLLSLVVALAVSVATATSAAALETRYTVEGKEVKAGESFPIEGSVGTAQLSNSILSEKLIIECAENKLANASIEGEGKSKGEYKFKACTLYELTKGTKESLAKCVIKVPIEFKFIDLVIDGPGGILEDEFKPSTGEEFVTIHIENKGEEICTLKGTYEITGTYVASIGDEGEVEKVEHELVITSTGSKLKIRKEASAWAYAMKWKLSSGKQWRFG